MSTQLSKEAPKSKDGEEAVPAWISRPDAVSAFLHQLNESGGYVTTASNSEDRNSSDIISSDSAVQSSDNSNEKKPATVVAEREKVHAKRKYNREQAAKARKRHKDTVVALQQRIEELCNYEQDLRKMNNILEAKLQMAQEQNQALLRGANIQARPAASQAGVNEALPQSSGITADNSSQKVTKSATQCAVPVQAAPVPLPLQQSPMQQQQQSHISQQQMQLQLVTLMQLLQQQQAANPK